MVPFPSWFLRVPTPYIHGNFCACANSVYQASPRGGRGLGTRLVIVADNMSVARTQVGIPEMLESPFEAGSKLSMKD